MSTEHLACICGGRRAFSRTGAGCAAIAAALVLSFSPAESGAAQPERPPDVSADRPYVQFYITDLLVKGWVMKVDLEEETFDFYDAMGRAEVPNLPFAQLPPTDRGRLRKWAGEGEGGGGGALEDEAVGALGPAGGEVIEARRFFFASGDPIVAVEIKEMSTKKLIFIQAKSIPVFSIHRDKVLRTETVKVRETVIYSSEYLYQKRKDQIAPESGADHYELAKYCMEIGDYEHAQEHFRRAMLLDPRIEPQAEERLAELELIIRAQVVSKLDKEIHGHYRAERCRQALTVIERLGKIDPRSRAYLRWMEKIGDIEKKLAQNLRREVVNSYYRKMDEMIRRYAWGRVTHGVDIPGKIVTTDAGTFKGRLIDETDEMITLEIEGREIRIAKTMVKSAIPHNMNQKKREATFAEAREYVTDAEGGLTADVMSGLVGQYGELIMAHMASQGEDEGEGEGEGEPDAEPVIESIFEPTGEEAGATPGEEFGPVAVEPYEDVKAEIKTYWEGRLTDIVTVTDKGIQRVLPVATQHSATYGPGSWLREGAAPAAVGDGAGETPDPEQWWGRLARARDVRYQILKAMAAEALCKVDRVVGANCSNCAGKGFITEMSLVDRTARKVCPLCKGIGRVYTVKYR